jgi:hypothetical protein
MAALPLGAAVEARSAKVLTKSGAIPTVSAAWQPDSSLAPDKNENGSLLDR